MNAHDCTHLTDNGKRCVCMTHCAGYRLTEHSPNKTTVRVRCWSCYAVTAFVIPISLSAAKRMRAADISGFHRDS